MLACFKSVPNAILVVCGDHFGLIVDRSPELLKKGPSGGDGGGLVGLVDDAIARGDRQKAVNFLSLEASHGRVRGQGGSYGGCFQKIVIRTRAESEYARFGRALFDRRGPLNRGTTQRRSNSRKCLAIVFLGYPWPMGVFRLVCFPFHRLLGRIETSSSKDR